MLFPLTERKESSINTNVNDLILSIGNPVEDDSNSFRTKKFNNSPKTEPERRKIEITLLPEKKNIKNNTNRTTVAQSCK